MDDHRVHSKMLFVSTVCEAGHLKHESLRVRRMSNNTSNNNTTTMSIHVNNPAPNNGDRPLKEVVLVEWESCLNGDTCQSNYLGERNMIKNPFQGKRSRFILNLISPGLLPSSTGSSRMGLMARSNRPSHKLRRFAPNQYFRKSKLSASHPVLRRSRPIANPIEGVGSGRYHRRKSCVSDGTINTHSLVWSRL